MIRALTLSTNSIWETETIMNRVNNWAIIALVFFLLAMGTILGFNVPALALGFGVVCLIALAMMLIRYEDYRKAVDVGYGASA